MGKFPISRPSPPPFKVQEDYFFIFIESLGGESGNRENT